MIRSQRGREQQNSEPDAGIASSERVWIVLTGGGTAGHVLPGLSMCEELERRGTPASAVHWVGSATGIETELVPEAGVDLTALPGRGLQRRWTAANVSTAVGLLKAFVQAWRLLGWCRPAVVVGLGGYASVSCCAAAALRGIPVVVAEQNAVAGSANRLLSLFAECSAVAFESTQLRGAHWVGNPVRSELLAVDREAGSDEARAALGVDRNRRLVAVFGGSLGARSINEAVAQAVSSEMPQSWGTRTDLHLRHISGRSGHAAARAAAVAAVAAEPRNSLVYELVEYEKDMASVYAAADLVVCRAGATTVAELAATGTPAVLVPLPGAPRDHQTANARMLVEAGAAVMVPDSQLSGIRLAAEVDALLGDCGRLDAMARAAAGLAQPDAACRVVDLLESHALRPRPSTL